MAALKVSDPRERSAQDRLSDLLPHVACPTLGYCAVTHATSRPLNVPLAGPLADGKCWAGVNVINLGPPDDQLFGAGREGVCT
jgi:hypothetical protein